MVPQSVSMPDSRSTNNDTLVRLDDQIGWYDRHSARQRRAFYLLKLVTIVAAAAIPVLASLLANIHLNILTSSLCALIVVVEGIQQLFQLQTNWILYRSACEGLKREKYLYLGDAGPYATAQNPRALLAERIEALISQELANWTTSQQSSGPQG